MEFTHFGVWFTLHRDKLAALREQYRERGYCMIDGLLNERQLAHLQAECSTVVTQAYDKVQKQIGNQMLSSEWILHNYGCIFQVRI